MTNSKTSPVYIYNSLTRKKEPFKPLKDDGRVGMYVCGPTVYDEPHIGHARSAYIFDVIRRYLLYKGYKVKFVRNVTDVDDKIIEKARSAFSASTSLSTDPEPRRRVSSQLSPPKADPLMAEAVSLKEKVKEISKKYLDAYHEDMAFLGIGKPDAEPKASEYIPKMVKFIERLIKKGRAYEARGDVYFDIRSAKAYGKLSNQNLEKMEIGVRQLPSEGKRDALDFALWKCAKPDEPSWPSPWGEGRPGWHIECSVMSSDILGDEFDIHGGGIDLIFPHHENEVAQSEGAGSAFARYWMHNGLLTIRAEKMAKSLGNYISIKDFIAKYADPDYLKLFFLSGHYRTPIDYTEERIEESKKEKERFAILLGKIARIMNVHGPWSMVHGQKSKGEPDGFRKRFEGAMEDDFNTPLALGVLFDLVTYANKLMHRKDKFSDGELKALAGAKKLILDLSAVFGLNLAAILIKAEVDEKNIRAMIARRDEARRSKDFKTADEIRDELAAKGIIIEDAKEGTIWRKSV